MEMVESVKVLVKAVLKDADVAVKVPPVVGSTDAPKHGETSTAQRHISIA